MIVWTWIIKLFKKNVNKKQLTSESDTDLKVNVQQQIETDPYKIILADSSKRVNKMKVYTNFFDNRYITDIQNQTEIIHDVFAANKNLAYKKLEQFHYYYTDNLIELLAKLKKSKEENMGVLTSQLKSIDNKINTRKKESKEISQSSVKNLANNKIRYAQNMSLQITSIYNCMVDNFDDFRFKKKALFETYAKKFGTQLGWSLPSELFLSLIDYNPDNQYKWEEYHIERKLMGRLHKNLFHIEFIGICVSGESSFELYKINETDDYFIFVHDTGVFKFIEFRKIMDLCNENNTYAGELQREIIELENKKLELKSKTNDVKFIDSKTEETLKTYITKIEDIELINNISTIDVERMNLESVLGLTRMEI